MHKNQLLLSEQLRHGLQNSDFATVRGEIRRNYRREESAVLEELLETASLSAHSKLRIRNRAGSLVEYIRAQQPGKSGVDALLNEFSLSSEEGVVLMCLAEALLRVPDSLTADRLIKDKLESGDWSSHLGQSDSMFVNASAWGLLLTGKVVRLSDQKSQFELLKKTIARLGEPVIRTSVRYAMQIMGDQFVMGKNIHSAIKRARSYEKKGYRYSYDMLGEGARTMADADIYFNAYAGAIEAIGKGSADHDHIGGAGISVKLSALHPRYELAQYDRVMAEVLPRLKELALKAKELNIGFTVDAEEADRLDLSLDVIERVFLDEDLQGWEGFGLAVQAYQKRALQVIHWSCQLAAKAGRKMMVRLVKGAYWDSEIKWSQEEGFQDYPVFTLKHNTDISYQACARILLENRDLLYPQFATHNAMTVATIMEMHRLSDLENKDAGFEFQRLHGMGEELFENLIEQENIPCRIYAPVGEHADLLAYLVRRLLENGANSSFVNNLVDENISIDSLIEDPIHLSAKTPLNRNPAIPLPADLFRSSPAEKSSRPNSKGLDLSDLDGLREFEKSVDSHQSVLHNEADSDAQIKVFNPACRSDKIGSLNYDSGDEINAKLESAQGAFTEWASTAVAERSELLRKLAVTLEKNRDMLIGLLVKEAGKSFPDGIAEVREAVDFCYYYADRAEEIMANSGKGETLYSPLGVALCISPWNFPLAIFLGQVCAALVVGNTVLAKPAEQTSLIAIAVLKMFNQCGFPEAVVQLVISPGKPAGELLVPDSRIQAVLFTGSTNTARWIAKTLAQRDDGNIPLIAETGGQNAMIVDSTALPEQTADDVIASGFLSAGQRCSALRVLFVQREVADEIIATVVGAMEELVVGDPQQLVSDVGPIIDDAALQRLQDHQQYLLQHSGAKLLYQCDISPGNESGNFFPPSIYEIDDISVLTEEVFGPVVHVIKYSASELRKVIADINGTNYGLTLGIHSRIKNVSNFLSSNIKAGNVYVNRNMVGAVVGVQPFGGRGLSGTGPKAGGPLYLKRLIKDTSQSETSDMGIASVDEMEAIDIPFPEFQQPHSSIPIPLAERIFTVQKNSFPVLGIPKSRR